MKNHYEIITSNCSHTVEDARQRIEKADEILKEFARFKKNEMGDELWQTEDRTNRFIVGLIAEMQDLRLDLDDLLYHIEFLECEKPDWEYED